MIPIKVRKELWVLFDPKTEQFVGARWRAPHYSLMYTLGDYETGYKLSSVKSAYDVLSTVSNYKQYSLLTPREIARIRVRRVYSHIIRVGENDEPAPVTVVGNKSRGGKNQGQRSDRTTAQRADRNKSRQSDRADTKNKKKPSTTRKGR